MKSGKMALSVGRRLSCLSWWWPLPCDTAVSEMMSLGSPVKPQVPENLRTRGLRGLHGSSQAWSVLELVSPMVGTEKLEFACRTWGLVLASGCCHLEEQAWDGRVQSLSLNASMHQEKPLTGRPVSACPCPLVVRGGVDPGGVLGGDSGGVKSTSGWW